MKGPKYFKVNEKKMDRCQESQLDKRLLLSVLSIFQFLVYQWNIHGCLNKVSPMFHCVQNQPPQIVDPKTVRKLEKNAWKDIYYISTPTQKKSFLQSVSVLCRKIPSGS